jgi:hypothetical protein
MERMVFEICNSLTSRLHPYGTLNQRVKREAQLMTIKLRYNLFEALDFRNAEDPSKKERTYPECESFSRTTSYSNQKRLDPTYFLRFPHTQNFVLEKGIQSRLAGYLTCYYDLSSVSKIQEHLPETVTRWDKVRLLDGDRIRGTWAQRDAHRNSTYVRVSQEDSFRYC